MEWWAIVNWQWNTSPSFHDKWQIQKVSQHNEKFYIIKNWFSKIWKKWRYFQLALTMKFGRSTAKKFHLTALHYPIFDKLWNIAHFLAMPDIAHSRSNACLRRLLRCLRSTEGAPPTHPSGEECTAAYRPIHALTEFYSALLLPSLGSQDGAGAHLGRWAQPSIHQPDQTRETARWWEPDGIDECRHWYSLIRAGRHM